MADSTVPEDTPETTSDLEVEDEEENEEEIGAKDEQNDNKAGGAEGEDDSQEKPKKKRTRKKKSKNSEPKGETTGEKTKKKCSDQVSGERNEARDSSTSQSSEIGSSCGKPDELDLHLDDVTESGEFSSHVIILRDTVKNLSRTVVQLSDENNRLLLKENKQLKKQFTKTQIVDSEGIGSLDSRVQVLEKTMKKVKLSRSSSTAASETSQIHQLKQQILKLSQQSNTHIMTVDKMKAAQQGEVERFDSAMEGLRQHLHTKDEEGKEEMDKFQKKMESFVKEKTQALETSVKLIQNLNVEAIETIKNIQEMKGEGNVPSIDGMTEALNTLTQNTNSSTAFG